LRGGVLTEVRPRHNCYDAAEATLVPTLGEPVRPAQQRSGAANGDTVQRQALREAVRAVGVWIRCEETPFDPSGSGWHRVKASTGCEGAPAPDAGLAHSSRDQ